MNDVWLLYLITRIDSLKTILGFGIVIWFGFLVAIGIGFSSTYSREEEERLGGWIKKVFSYWKFPVLFAVLLALIPSKNDIIFIYAGTNILDVAKSDETKRVAGKSVAVFEKYLDEFLKEEKK